jgi:hypothetical protein
MAMMLFTLLNGLAVVFLLYVLVQFWKEGHRPTKPATRDRVIESSMKDRPTVVVVTHPISHFAHGGLSVVSRQVRLSGLQDGQLHRDSVDGVAEAPLKRYSSR